MTEELITNEQIRARSIRLITDKETRVIPFNEALAHARRLGLDLLQIAAGEPATCRILDSDRYRYERKKVEREHARRQREMTIDTKEIQLRPVTDLNDLSIKARRAKTFLGAGDKVKVIVRFRGRERYHRDYGRRVIERFLSELGEHKIDRPMADGDSDLTIVIASVISKADLLKQKIRPSEITA